MEAYGTPWKLPPWESDARNSGTGNIKSAIARYFMSARQGLTNARRRTEEKLCLGEISNGKFSVLDGVFRVSERNSLSSCFWSVFRVAFNALCDLPRS